MFRRLSVSSARGDELFDTFDGLNAAAGADGGAVECGGGAGEIELALQRPALQEPINKTCVENVTSARGVNRLDAKRGGVVESRPVPGQYSSFAQRCGGKAAAKSFPQRGQGLAQIRLFHEPPRNIPAGDEVADILQQRFDARINFIQVSDNRDADGAGPACGYGRRGSIVPIYVKSTRLGDPFALEFFRAKGQARVAFPENGAFAGVIHKNERLLAGTPGGREEMRRDAEPGKFRAVHRGSAVVAQFTDVTGTQSPLLASNHGGGDLAAGQDIRGSKFDLGPARGIVFDGNERVGGIESNADDVNLGGFGHFCLRHCRRSAGICKGGTADSVKARRSPEIEATNEKQGQGGGAQDGGGPPMEREARGARHGCKNREDTGGHGNHEPVQRAP